MAKINDIKSPMTGYGLKVKDPLKVAKTPFKKSLQGSGDYYGTGYRNPVGKMREGPKPIPKEGVVKPPKSLA